MLRLTRPSSNRENLLVVYLCHYSPLLAAVRASKNASIACRGGVTPLRVAEILQTTM